MLYGGKSGREGKGGEGTLGRQISILLSNSTDWVLAEGGNISHMFVCHLRLWQISTRFFP